MAVGRQLSLNCTTGWLDWTRGQLWLLPDGILRLQVPLVDKVHAPRLLVDPAQPAVREFAPDEAATLAARRRGSVWVPSNEIVAATFRSGLTTDSLKLSRRGQSPVKLLWLRRDRAEQPLREAITGWGVAVDAASR